MVPNLPLSPRHEYRRLYRAGLHAVRYSKPARYFVRDILREAFRKGHQSDYDPKKIANTVEFLQNAARRRGLEHKIVKNLLLFAYWRRDRAGYPPFNNLDEMAPQRNIHAIRNELYRNFEDTIKLLNETTKMDLRV